MTQFRRKWGEGDWRQGPGERPELMCTLLSMAIVSALGLDMEGAGCLGSQLVTGTGCGAASDLFPLEAPCGQGHSTVGNTQLPPSGWLDWFLQWGARKGSCSVTV